MKKQVDFSSSKNYFQAFSGVRYKVNCLQNKSNTGMQSAAKLAKKEKNGRKKD